MTNHSAAAPGKRLSVLAFCSLAYAAAAWCSDGDITYQPDTAFNGGIPIDDRFANGDINNYNAQHLARAANGDVIVAGIVPAAYQSSGGNLGLVRYTSAGARTSWSNPTADYSSYFNIYLTYPNSPTANYTSIVDLKVQDGYIFVLADYANSPSNSDVLVIVFRDDGTFINAAYAFGTGYDEHGIGLVPYAYFNAIPQRVDRLVAAANYTDGSGRSVVTLKRFKVAAGVLTVDTVFGPYGNGANDIHLPPAMCDSGAACDVRGVAATGVATDTGTPRVYVSAAAGVLNSFGSTDYELAVLGIDGNSGGLLSGFGTQTSGIYYDSSDMGGAPGAITATTQGSIDSDAIYVASNFQFCGLFDCSYTAFLSKLRARSGLPPPLDGTSPDFSWGNGGTVTLYNTALAAIAVDGSQNVIGVGGTSDLCVDGQGGLYVCGAGFAVSVAPTDTALSGPSSVIPAFQAGGGTWSYQTWSDIIPGPVSGTFTVTGSMGDAAPNSNAQFGTTQLIASDEGIFRSSFE